MSEDNLLDRRPLPQLPQLPQLSQPLSRLLPLSLHRLLLLATLTRTPLRVHRANHGVSRPHHVSSVALQHLLRQPAPARLLERPSGTKVAQVGCRVGPPITGQLTLEGIPVLGLVDTGASVTCLGFDIWWRYRAQWGPLRQFEGAVHGVHGKPLQIAGKTQHLDLQWGEARGRACFIVIVGLESPPCLIGMDIMRPLRVHIDVTHGPATPAQPDPQTIHLNTAQSRQQLSGKNGLPTTKAACPPQNLPQQKKMPLQGTEIPATETAPTPQSQPQRKKMPLLETDFAAVDTARPPQTQSQRMEMPLLDVNSPDMGAAFPLKFSQQRMEMPLPGINPSTVGAANPSRSQPQRREMPSPEM